MAPRKNTHFQIALACILRCRLPARQTVQVLGQNKFGDFPLDFLHICYIRAWRYISVRPAHREDAYDYESHRHAQLCDGKFSFLEAT